MFKKLLYTAAFCFAFSFTTDAQRIAVVDITDVLESLSDYQSAERDLDKLAAEWRQDIAQEYDKIKSLYNKYQAEQVLLSDDVKRQREEEIMGKEETVRELQKRKFGPEGELFLRRQELISPIQDKVYAAIQDLADDRGYDLILDKNSSTGILFASEEYDKTATLKQKLGIR